MNFLETQGSLITAIEMMTIMMWRNTSGFTCGGDDDNVLSSYLTALSMCQVLLAPYSGTISE
jgi:hypothetical protein